MNVNLRLSPERQAALERRAAAAGTDLSGYILRVVDENLALDAEPTVPVARDQWRKKFEAWIAAHKPRNSHVDDSRESIYD